MPASEPPLLLNIWRLAFGPRWSSNPHSHSGFRETLVILEGRIAVRTSSGSCEAESGAVVTYPARLVHSETALDERPVSMLCIAWRNGPAEEPPFLAADLSGRIRMLGGWLQEIADDPVSRRDAALTQSLLRALVHQLTRGRPLRAQDRIEQARRALEAAPADEVDLNELARNSGMSRSTFQRRFRALAGCSPMSFLRRHRLEQAKRYLEFTGLKLSEIATQVGFSDEFQLSRAFKNHFGGPPARFRKTRLQRGHALDENTP